MNSLELFLSISVPLVVLIIGAIIQIKIKFAKHEDDAKVEVITIIAYILTSLNMVISIIFFYKSLKSGAPYSTEQVLVASLSSSDFLFALISFGSLFAIKAFSKVSHNIVDLIKLNESLCEKRHFLTSSSSEIRKK